MHRFIGFATLVRDTSLTLEEAEMTNVTMKIAVAAFTGCLIASGAYAAPITLSEAQLDAVAAGGVDRVEGFVCPVITTDGVLNSVHGIQIGEGHYSILGPTVFVPLGATNADGEGGAAGSGTPPGPHAQPGDTDYTAIWFGPRPE
jgi:hypothetical protein